MKVTSAEMNFKCQRLGLDEGKTKVKTLNPRGGTEGEREKEAEVIKSELHLIHRSLRARDTALQLHMSIYRNNPYPTWRLINQLEN